MHKCLFLVSLLLASVICVDNNSTMTAWRKHIIQSHIFEITILHKFVVTTFPKSTQNNNMPYKYIYLHRVPSFLGIVHGYFDTLFSDSDATLFEIGMLWCAKFYCRHLE
ncbi:unnamed protein product [Schistosoma haematobium]|nr:unnamed protein product [Schistosoma haematobium]